MSGWRIAPALPGDAADRAVLRAALWPDGSVADHAGEIAAELAADGERRALIARDAVGAVVGLAEAAVRRDPVNGCERSPVLFLEGLYVAPGWRRRGLGRALVAALAEWGAALGLAEFGSDAPADNAASHAFHCAAGFAETDRVVFFRRALDGS